MSHELIKHEEYLTRDEAAKFIGTHPGCLDRWRYGGAGPKWIKSGTNRVRYKKSDLIAWMADENRFYPDGSFGPDFAANERERNRISQEALDKLAAEEEGAERPLREGKTGTDK